MLRAKVCVLMAVLAFSFLPGCARKPINLNVNDGGTLDFHGFGKVTRQGCTYTLIFPLDGTGVAGQVQGDGELFHKDVVHNIYTRVVIKECIIRRVEFSCEPTAHQY